MHRIDQTFYLLHTAFNKASLACLSGVLSTVVIIPFQAKLCRTSTAAYYFVSAAIDLLQARPYTGPPDDMDAQPCQETSHSSGYSRDELLSQLQVRTLRHLRRCLQVLLLLKLLSMLHKFLTVSLQP